MLHKQFASRLLASLAISVTAGNSLAAVAQTPVLQTHYYETPASTGQQVTVDKKLLLASHDAGSSSLGAVDLLGTQPAGGPGEMVSDSLWGNLILQMAYARDREITRAAKKLRLTDNLTLASIFGISAVSLAQGITGVAQLNQGHGDGSSTNMEVEQPAQNHEGMEEGGEHAGNASASHHGESEGRDSYAPGVLGIIAGGSTILALGLRYYFGHRYSKQIKQRQRAVRAKVEAILTRFEKGESPEQLRGELLPLIGERATKEFTQLWRSSHQIAAAGASS